MTEKAKKICLYVLKFKLIKLYDFIIKLNIVFSVFSQFNEHHCLAYKILALKIQRTRKESNNNINVKF